MCDWHVYNKRLLTYLLTYFIVCETVDETVSRTCRKFQCVLKIRIKIIKLKIKNCVLKISYQKF